MDKKGFTMIEVIATISVIGIILSITFLKLDTDMFYMDKMANEFVCDVRYVQAESMKNTVDGNYKIYINETNGHYKIIKGTSDKKLVEFKKRFKIHYSGTGNLSFTYDGIPVNAGTFRITDTRNINKFKEITIVPATGRTVIIE